jgi:thymidylate kinase
MKEIHSFAIEGQVGAGKTTLIKEIVRELKSAGDLVSVIAPFTTARDRLGKGEYLTMYNLFTAQGEDGALIAEAELARVVEEGREEFRGRLQDSLHESGIIIYDRHWLTVLCSLEDATFSTPRLKDELLKKWMTNVPPTFFIDASDSVIKSKKDMDKIPWVREEKLLELELARRRALFLQYRMNFLSEPIRIETVGMDFGAISSGIISKIKSTLRKP